MTDMNFTVTGMTCDHCAASVTEEVSEVPGVTGVDVDLPTGRLIVTSGAPIDADKIRSAVREAGYEVAN
ncbi:MAG: heavy-metal-associated domain-containing protein [Tomitella sp.]|nr:heavy-metal-associated domain-containing protein [Tomitella sp.]